MSIFGGYFRDILDQDMINWTANFRMTRQLLVLKSMVFCLVIAFCLSSCIESLVRMRSSLPKGVQVILDSDYYRYDSIAWSPNQDLIAITTRTYEPSSSKILILDLSTNVLSELLDSRPGSGLIIAESWVAGKEFLLVSSTGDKYKRGLWKVDIWKSPPDTFYINDGFAGEWSIEKRFAWIKHTEIGSNFEIWMNSQSSQSNVLLYESRNKLDHLSWSKDGESILFIEYPSDSVSYGNLQLLSTTKNGGITTIVHNTAMDVDSSKTSDLISYVRVETSHIVPTYHLTFFNLNTKCSTSIEYFGNVFSPSWSPDGKRVAFLSDFGILIIDLEEYFGVADINTINLCKLMDDAYQTSTE